MSDDYGYINARVRAMESFLLKEADYEEALRQKTQDGFISFLSSLPSYAQDLRQVLTISPQRFICDEALKLNLCRIFRKIFKFSEGEPKRLIIILLTHWDIYNLKTIIRGIISFKDKAEIIQTLIPAGRWDLEFLKRIAESKSLKALANNLTILSSEDDFEKELAELISDSQDAPLEILENSLQEVYFREAQEYLSKRNGNAKTLLDYLSLKIDFLNILSILKKIVQTRKSINFIKGGRLPEAFLKDLSSLKSVEDVLETCGESPNKWLAQEGLQLYRRDQRLSSLERLFKKREFFFCSKLYSTADPLSIGIPLAFINFKENEINNLRFIGRAIHFGMPLGLVKEEITFAG